MNKKGNFRVQPDNQPVKDEYGAHDCYKLKDIHHTAGSAPGLSLLYHSDDLHVAGCPQNDRKVKASMLESSWVAFQDKEKYGQDRLTGALKKTMDQRNMFRTSENIFGSSAIDPKPQQKKQSNVKTAEIMGTNPADQLSAEKLCAESKHFGSAKKRADCMAVHASEGAMGTLNHYNDNDICENLCDTKHSNVHGVTLQGPRENWKPKAKVSWAHG
jgi:hypothetical protein